MPVLVRSLGFLFLGLLASDPTSLALGLVPNAKGQYGPASITQFHGAMLYKVPTKGTLLQFEVEHDEISAKIASAVVEKGVVDASEVEQYVLELRAFLIRNLDYPPTIELPIERIKNRSRAEMQWRYRRQHALANVEQLLETSSDRAAEVAATVAMADRAVCLTQPVSSNERHQGSGMWKLRVLRQYAEQRPRRVFVETGTFVGQTVDAVVGAFDQITSIEFDPTLAAEATARFRAHAHVTIVHGNSERKLAGVLSAIAEPAMFWLDAHYEGGNLGEYDWQCPLMRELRLILTHTVRDHLILIDDARIMNGHGECYYEDWNDRGLCDWPSIREIHELVCDLRPDMQFYLAEDIIRIHI